MSKLEVEPSIDSRSPLLAEKRLGSELDKTETTSTALGSIDTEEQESNAPFRAFSLTGNDSFWRSMNSSITLTSEFENSLFFNEDFEGFEFADDMNPDDRGTENSSISTEDERSKSRASSTKSTMRPAINGRLRLQRNDSWAPERRIPSRRRNLSVSSSIFTAKNRRFDHLAKRDNLPQIPRRKSGTLST